MNSHARLIKLGLDTNPLVATRLLNEYVSSRSPNSLSHAHQLFDQVPHKDTILWSSIISAYTRSGHSYKALQLFSHMLLQAHPTHQPNSFVYATAARACASSTGTYLQLGRTVHACVIKSGFIPNNVVVETAFLDMYAKCGFIDCAQRVFDEMPERNLVTWNAMITGYVHHEKEIHGFELFYRMKCRELFVPDEFTVATVLVGCAWTRDLRLGMQVHGYLIVNGFESDCVNSVCNMYFQCGEVSCAERILDGIEVNAILKLIKIRGYFFNQRYHDVIRYVAFEKNVAEIFRVDYTIIAPVLTACTKLSLLKVGRQVHGLLVALINTYGNCSLLEGDDAIIGSALIDMYCKCGSVRDARKVFNCWQPAKHVSHWNAMITGYIFCGLVDDGRTLLEEMPERNAVSWTSMISGYVQKGMPLEGLNLLAKMYADEEGLRVEGNCLTFVTVLEACSHLTDLERGKQVHAKLIRTLANADVSNVVLGTALVDMYAKSGNFNSAQIMFDRMLEKNVVAWTSIIMGYAVNGLGSRALEMFQQMIEMGIGPNEVTFVSVLTACSYCGLVEEGLQCFKMMKKYRMVPREDHYTCLIDMLGRVGRLEEAWILLEEIEDRERSDGYSSGTIWAAMLGACQLHGNVEMGRRVAEKMLEKKQQISTTYIALSNVYAAAGMWNEAYSVRECLRREGYIHGESGLSRICTS